jgi:hypothetical protein
MDRGNLPALTQRDKATDRQLLEAVPKEVFTPFLVPIGLLALVALAFSSQSRAARRQIFLIWK